LGLVLLLKKMDTNFPMQLIDVKNMKTINIQTMDKGGNGAAPVPARK
jgi:hypothetical protein